MELRNEHGGTTYFNRLPVLVCLAVPLALHIERTAAPQEVYTGASKPENPWTQMRVAESRTELDPARLLIRNAAGSQAATPAPQRDIVSHHLR